MTVNNRVSYKDRMTGNRRSQNAVGYAGGKLLPSTRTAEKSSKIKIEDRCNHQVGKVLRYG
jgi:hypothetical protein